MLKGNIMFNDEEFIEKFVKAAQEEDNSLMKKLSDSIADFPLDRRAELLEKLIEAMKKEEVKEDYTKALDSILELMKVALESKDVQEKDSAGEEAKDNTEAKEVTQDVAADTSAEEAKTEESEASEEGEAPAEEVKEEKTEEEK